MLPYECQYFLAFWMLWFTWQSWINLMLSAEKSSWLVCHSLYGEEERPWQHRHCCPICSILTSDSVHSLGCILQA
ncbi:hypothetical protein KP509_10G026400 [Ceratopteris richardii]|uniref:Uncharacterized protein n=1 Tax=Ceratopteris richardii TaxID=49495 RepID=A0A8T2TX97_CERRI|nr:hypothetical protein KP509_10G026400 [Ceratopteris richardii]